MCEDNEYEHLHLEKWNGCTLQDVAALFVVAIATYLVYAKAIKPFLSPLRQMPGLPYGPIFGNVRQAMTGEAMASSTSWSRKYGDVFRFYYLLGEGRVMVTSAEAIRHVMVVHAKNYRRPKSVVVGDFVPTSLIVVDGAYHRSLRRLMAPAFKTDAVLKMYPILQSSAECLCQHWLEIIAHKSEVQVDCQQGLISMALDVIGECAFGYKFNCMQDPNSVSVKAFSKILGIQLVSFKRIIPFYSYLPTKENKEFKHCEQYVRGIVNDVIAKKRKSIAEDSQFEAENFLDMLLTLKRENGERLTDQELCDSVFTFVIAGHDSTAMAMSWLLLKLAENLDVQEKVFTEVSDVLPSDGLSIKPEHVEKLKYTTWVVKETLRLFPSFPAFVREAVHDDFIDGYKIPAKTKVVCHLGALMRNGKYWENPDDFCPSRFEDSAKNQPFTWMPFNGGPHMCIAYKLALAEMKITAATLVRKLKFETVPGLKIHKKMKLGNMRPTPSIQLFITKR